MSIERQRPAVLRHRRDNVVGGAVGDLRGVVRRGTSAGETVAASGRGGGAASPAALAAAVRKPCPDTHRNVLKLVQNGKMTVSFSRHTGNPHMKRLLDLPVPERLALGSQYAWNRDGTRSITVHLPSQSRESCSMTCVARPETLPLVGLGNHRVAGDSQHRSLGLVSPLVVYIGGH